MKGKPLYTIADVLHNNFALSVLLVLFSCLIGILGVNYRNLVVVKVEITKR
jgi:hypothetical protein